MYFLISLGKNSPPPGARPLKNMSVKLNLKDLNSKRLIDDKVAQVTSELSSNVDLRKLVHNFQKKVAYDIPKGFNGSVLNGRDITYNIVPDADLKFYVTASLNERSKRRFLELKKLGKKTNFKDILKSLRKRDQSDRNRSRKQGKLEKTKDSRLINTTRLSITECFLKVRKIIDRKLKN